MSRKVSVSIDNHARSVQNARSVRSRTLGPGRSIIALCEIGRSPQGSGPELIDSNRRHRPSVPGDSHVFFAPADLAGAAVVGGIGIDAACT